MKTFAHWIAAGLLALGTGLAVAAEVLLGPGDVVRLSVYGSPDLSVETRVSEGGAVQMVHASWIQPKPRVVREAADSSPALASSTCPVGVVSPARSALMWRNSSRSMPAAAARSSISVSCAIAACGTPKPRKAPAGVSLV